MIARLAPPSRVPAAWFAGLLLLAAGCSGGAGTAGAPPDARVPATPPPGTPAAADGFDVTITASNGLVYVDNLEVEANRRRGIFGFFGFFQDRYDTMVQIPFADVTQIEFRGPMPAPIFDVVKETRQDQAVHREHTFETYITFRNGDKQLFYAWIPKLRGEKDFQQWEFSMNSNADSVEKIEFNR